MMCLFLLSIFVSIQWPLGGVFHFSAHPPAAAEPQPDHSER